MCFRTLKLQRRKNDSQKTDVDIKKYTSGEQKRNQHLRRKLSVNRLSKSYISTKVEFYLILRSFT